MTTDPRGPHRKVVGIEEWSHATKLMFDCGHVGEHAPHFAYCIGDYLPCFDCGPPDQPSHTEGHIDCPACDLNRWEVLRKERAESGK